MFPALNEWDAVHEKSAVSALLAGQKALAPTLPSATDLLGREHMVSHEVFDLLEDGLSFQRLAEQSVICGRCHRPGETQRDTRRSLYSPGGDENSFRFFPA